MKLMMLMLASWNKITRVLYGPTGKVGVGFQKEVLFVILSLHANGHISQPYGILFDEL